MSADVFFWLGDETSESFIGLMIGGLWDLKQFMIGSRWVVTHLLLIFL